MYLIPGAVIRGLSEYEPRYHELQFQDHVTWRNESYA